jgi:hypothetical protein
MDDARRKAFLSAVDESDRVDVDDYEAKFLDSNLGRENFTPKQRDFIDKMVIRYGDKLKW